MKNIFVVDWCLAIAFILTALSGFMLHYAGHFSTHDVWHNLAVFHIVASLFFVILSILHIKHHLGWYKSLFRKGIKNKSIVTVNVSFIYVVTLITGVALLCVTGANSDIGLWHYRIGILLAIMAIAHFIIRFPILLKSLRK